MRKMLDCNFEVIRGLIICIKRVTKVDEKRTQRQSIFTTALLGPTNGVHSSASKKPEKITKLLTLQT